MPSKGTTARNVRVADEVWLTASRKAKAVGYADVSEFVRLALTKLAGHEKGTGIVVVTPPRGQR